MRSLPKPRHSVAEVLDLCCANIQSNDLFQRLSQTRAALKQLESDYDRMAVNSAWFGIQGTTSLGQVTGSELLSLYENKFSKLGQRARTIYDRIKTACEHNRCPLCGQRTVSTLDHYLPKARFVALAITPINLIPACSDCNKTKLSRVVVGAEEQTLHPYYDSVDDAVWLKAEVQEVANPSVLFKPDPPSHWPALKKKRVQTHFKTFALGNLYTSHAAQELANISGFLVQLFDRAGANALKEHLAEQAASRAAAWSNSWQSALYFSLSESEWFCTRGYRLISP